MEFPFAPQYKAAILRQYDRNISRFPVIREEVAVFLQGKEETFTLCLKYLYGHLSVQDMLSFSVEVFSGYVRSTLEAFQQIPYLKTIPAEIFFPYVLYHRINSEYLDGSRMYFLSELLPYVQGKTMEQAALAVNYWCYAHATYTPADDRTLGPLGVLNRTLGRCGEESVLTVAALRSVGIPARQCYCPRWSHCDDNHAWVEVWIDGEWHYMGACEPEPVLDRGWFTSAASRAMLVDTKCWADWSADVLYETVNCTHRYASTRLLSVQVTENGQPIPDARVQFQIVNYSELYTLWETLTDAQGFARFETGLGDLVVCVQHAQNITLRKVDLRQQNSIIIPLEKGFPEHLSVNLVPPEDSSNLAPYEEDPHHAVLLGQCESHLAQRRAGFSQHLHHAALNIPQIRRFLEDPRYPEAHKEELLSTLRIKDFVDITAETLTDALDTANLVREQYPDNIFRDYILSPRIADEMLLPERKQIRQLFPRGFDSPREALRWMQTHMQILADEGISNYYPSAFGCLRCRQVPAFAFDMVFVALCRAFCFPARLESHTGQAQWLDAQGVWHPVSPTPPPALLTLEFPAGKELNYFEHFTVSYWNGSDFVTLKYPNLKVESSHTFCLQPGFYRVSATVRQIDGTASTNLWHLTVSGNTTLQITLPEDQTPQKLKEIPLRLPDGPLKNSFHATGENSLLIFADPGSEPTEHLLREMLVYAEAFRCLPCRILLCTKSPHGIEHPTIQLLKAALPESLEFCTWDCDALTALRRQMQVGDLRLPFVICTDTLGQGIYADANYRIGLAQTLMTVHRLLSNCSTL